MFEQIGFWEAWEVWLDPVLVSTMAAALLAYLGVWVSLKRVVYVPLALSQVSSLGVVAAFLVEGWLVSGVGEHAHSGLMANPVLYSLLFAVLIALYFARPGRESGNAVVVAYLVAAALVLFLGNFIRKDMHDVKNVLFGSAVLVERVQLIYVGGAGLLVALLHLVMYRRFLFTSFDPETAGASGIPVYLTEFLLYASFAVMISVTTRAIGALPAFGLMVLPGLTGLRLGRSMRAAFGVAVLVGVISAFFGYYLSFIDDRFPTGASMVGISGVLYILTLFIPKQKIQGG